MALAIEFQPAFGCGTDQRRVIVTGITGGSAGDTVQLRLTEQFDGVYLYSGILESANTVDVTAYGGYNVAPDTLIYFVSNDTVIGSTPLVNNFYNKTVSQAIDIESGATGDYAGLYFVMDGGNVTLTGWDESDYNYYTAYWYTSDPSATIGSTTVPSGSVYNAYTGQSAWDSVMGDIGASGQPLYGLRDGTDLWCVIVQGDDPMAPEASGITEVKAILQCRVRCNVAPIDITLSNTTATTSDTAATIGTLTATDPNVTDTHTWTLSAQTDNAATPQTVDYFSLSNNTVSVAASTPAGTYHLTFVANDGMATYTKSLAVEIVAPHAITGFTATANSSTTILCSFVLPADVSSTATINWQRSITDPDAAGFNPTIDWVTIATTDLTGTDITE